jgi:hypothetical protein
MHSNGKGLSRSALPYKRSAPSWLKITAQEVCRRATGRGRRRGCDRWTDRWAAADARPLPPARPN